MSLRYEELAPPAAYARWIACCWQSRGVPHVGVAAHRVLPDGCADLILDLAAWRAGAAAAEVVGPMSTAAVVPLTGELDVFGVRFRPGALGTFVRANVRELAGLAIPPGDLGLAVELPFERLAATPSLALRTARVLAALRPWLRDARTPDAAVAHALAQWRRPASGRGLAPVAVLARDVGVSERTLERRFAAHVGYAPAQFRRLARFRHVLQLHARGGRDWVALAVDCGYADQPHLVRDFRAFAGLSPEAWAREQARVGFVQDGDVTVD